MLFSYVMGIDESIYELEEYGFSIKEDKSNYMVSFLESSSEIWEKFIKSKLKVGFWNEYISSESFQVVFNFHLADGFKRFVVDDFENDEVLILCEKLCNCKFDSLKKMLMDNRYYNEQIFKPNKIFKILANAKKNTYANGDSLKANSSRLASKDYHYEDVVDGVKYIYHDTYFGGEKFIGEEVLYTEDSPIWAMNYRGYSIDDDLSEDVMDKILRPALMKVGEDKNILPLRGPREFVNGEYKYTFNLSGTFENFSGIEKIYKKDVLIYELVCSGGLIK